MTNDAGTVVPIGDGSVSPDAGSDAGSDAAMVAIDGGPTAPDAYVEGVDAAMQPDAYVELPDAYIAPPDAYVAPDACAYGTWYVDADHDGFGSTMALSGCSQPAGTVSNATDCDDAAPTRHPGAPEVCNGIDDDCDGVADIIPTWYFDSDGDGHGTAMTHLQACAMPPMYVASSDDCNDSHATVYPGAPEICDMLRNDCTGAAPDAELLHTYYVDCDRDGFASSSTGTTTCQPVGAPPACSTGQYVMLRPTDATNTDCADFDASLTPTTSWYPDCDGDNYVVAGAVATHSCTPPATNACSTGTASIPHGVWTHAPGAGTDCWDFHGAAYPGSTMTSTTPYSTGVGTSFDWNCDGVATQVITAVASNCSHVITTGACLPATATWYIAPPPCGNTGTLFTCGGLSCTATYTNVVAACH